MNKIKSVRTYQSVTFEKRVETFFSVVPMPGRPSDMEIEILKDILCVQLKSPRDLVLVPFTNISSICMWTDEDDVKEAEKKIEAAKPVGVKLSEIKRPK